MNVRDSVFLRKHEVTNVYALLNWIDWVDRISRRPLGAKKSRRISIRWRRRREA